MAGAKSARTKPLAMTKVAVAPKLRGKSVPRPQGHRAEKNHTQRKEASATQCARSQARSANTPPRFRLRRTEPWLRTTLGMTRMTNCRSADAAVAITAMQPVFDNAKDAAAREAVAESGAGAGIGAAFAADAAARRRRRRGGGGGGDGGGDGDGGGGGGEEEDQVTRGVPTMRRRRAANDIDEEDSERHLRVGEGI